VSDRSPHHGAGALSLSETDPVTNDLTGTPDTPVSIPMRSSAECSLTLRTAGA